MRIETSEQIDSIAAALVKAQAEIKPAAKDATNPHFKSRYADLASVVDACRDALIANGLAVVQSASAEDERVTVSTMLVHSSGQWIGGELTMKARDASPQSIGSAITYGRRYQLASIVGVAPDDDDGEAAQPKRNGQSRPVAQSHETSKAEQRATITEQQKKAIKAYSSAKGIDVEAVSRERYGREVDALTSDEAKQYLDWLVEQPVASDRARLESEIKSMLKALVAAEHPYFVKMTGEGAKFDGQRFTQFLRDKLKSEFKHCVKPESVNKLTLAADDLTDEGLARLPLMLTVALREWKERTAQTDESDAVF